MQLLAEIGQQIAHPGFQREEARIGIVGLAALVVGTADDQDVGLASAGLQPDVVISLQRIPVEPIGEGILRHREGHRVGAVGRLLGMDRVAIVDRRVGSHDGLRCKHPVTADRDYLDTIAGFLDLLHDGVGIEAPSRVADGGSEASQVLERVERSLVRDSAGQASWLGRQAARPSRDAPPCRPCA